MPTLIDIDRLPAPLAEEVRKAERARLLRRDTLLTYQEAALVYGYTYITIRHWVSEGRLTPVEGVDGRRYLTHAEMQRYMNEKKVPGAPRRAERTN